MDGIYGSVTSGYINAPNLSKCAKIICAENRGEYDYVVEFYIYEGKLYYCNVIAGSEEWHEFIPYDFCSLDGINTLLEKD